MSSNNYIKFKDINWLTNENFDRNNDQYGKEAYIKEIINQKIAKIFFKDKNNIISKEDLKNKENKLLILKEYQELKDICSIPEFIIKNFNYIDGYTMDKFDGQTICDVSLNFNDKIAILKKIKEHLLLLNQYNILYFDFNFANIMIKVLNNDLIVKLVDMDSAMVGNYKYETIYFPMIHYLIKGGSDNFNAEIFSFNKFTYDFLLSDGYIYLSEKGYLDQLATYNITSEDFKDICKNLYHNNVDSIADHEFLIDIIDNNKKRMVI